MNYTENYHLPQWDETDRIMREDFNQMCLDMEAGLKAGVSGAAAGDAQVAAAAAAATQTAQATADKAVADAARAQAKADAAYAPDQPPYVVGSYIGNGSRVTVTLGFRPKFVIASGGKEYEATICVGEQTSCDNLRITDTGFVAAYISYPELAVEDYPIMAKQGHKYNYIAFR